MEMNMELLKSIKIEAADFLKDPVIESNPYIMIGFLPKGILQFTFELENAELPIKMFDEVGKLAAAQYAGEFATVFDKIYLESDSTVVKAQMANLCEPWASDLIVLHMRPFESDSAYCHVLPYEMKGGKVCFKQDIRDAQRNTDDIRRRILAAFFAELFKRELNRAKNGEAEAQHNVAVSYENGKGTIKNLEEAIQWYQKASLQGYIPASTNLGICYLEGKGIPQDKVNAIRLLEYSANKNDRMACMTLALFYKKESKYSEYMKWLHRAGNNGNAQALLFLGIHYWEGIIVQRDQAKAFKYMKKSASKFPGSKEAFNKVFNRHNPYWTQWMDDIVAKFKSKVWDYPIP